MHCLRQQTENVIGTGAVDGVSAIFGLHVFPSLDVGKFESRAGTLLAATNSFTVVITGKGGHGAMPHDNIDPWPTVANLILSYQVSNEIPEANTELETIVSNVIKSIP